VTEVEERGDGSGEQVMQLCALSYTAIKNGI
jgi:hypothetical protein